MIRSRQAKTFIGLRHKIANEYLDGRRLNDCLGDPAHQQVRNQACEQRPGTDRDQVGVSNRVQRLGSGPTFGGTRANSRILPLLAVIRVSPRTSVPSSSTRFQFHARHGCGIDVAARQQNLRRESHRLGKISSDRGQGRQKKISEAMAFQAGAFLEAVLEQSRKQGFVFGEGNDAIAHVARRKHVEFFAQTAAGSAIVAHRDHAAQFANGGLTGSGQRRAT